MDLNNHMSIITHVGSINMEYVVQMFMIFQIMHTICIQLQKKENESLNHINYFHIFPFTQQQHPDREPKPHTN